MSLMCCRKNYRWLILSGVFSVFIFSNVMFAQSRSSISFETNAILIDQSQAKTLARSVKKSIQGHPDASGRIRLRPNVIARSSKPEEKPKATHSIMLQNRSPQKETQHEKSSSASSRQLQLQRKPSSTNQEQIGEKAPLAKPSIEFPAVKANKLGKPKGAHLTESLLRDADKLLERKNDKADQSSRMQHAKSDKNNTTDRPHVGPEGVKPAIGKRKGHNEQNTEMNQSQQPGSSSGDNRQQGGNRIQSRGGMSGQGGPKTR